MLSFLDYGIPTSVDFVRSNPCQLVVSYSSSRAVLFDTETGKKVLDLNSTLTSGNTHLYFVCCNDFIFYRQYTSNSNK